MTRRAISFLGYTRPGQPYRETTYVFGDQECTSAFMAEATARFFQTTIDELLVLVTHEARQQNFADLARAIGDIVPLRPIDIPSGRDEAELWQIFDLIAEQIHPRDEIIFDITNGFRSLPVLVLLAASFVRVARDATVKQMIYGAFDAQQDGRTPVFDLTPFLRLLDWTTATDAFLRYGRADALVPLTRQAAEFQPIANTLETLTLALQTSRPAETMQMACNLEQRVKSASMDSDPAVRPFTLLLNRVGSEYGLLAHETPMDPVQGRTVIRRQLAMIQWYVDKGLYVQAITMAREWLITVVIAEHGGNLFDYITREVANAAMNNHKYAEVRRKRYDVPPHMLATAQRQLIHDLWIATRDLRNDIGHTGMRERPEQARAVVERVRNVCAQLPQALEAEGERHDA